MIDSCFLFCYTIDGDQSNKVYIRRYAQPQLGEFHFVKLVRSLQEAINELSTTSMLEITDPTCSWTFHGKPADVKKILNKSK